MSIPDPVIVISNVFVLATAFTFLFTIIFFRLAESIDAFLVLFICAASVWAIGFILAGVTPAFDSTQVALQSLALGLVELGFAISSITFYGITAAVSGTLSRNVRIFLLGAIGLSTLYIVSLTVISVPGGPVNQSTNWLLFFFLVFDFASVVILWRYRRTIANPALAAGGALFIVGHGLSFANPGVSITSLATLVCALGILVICLSVVYQRLISPLRSRGEQLESLHNVSIAITRRIASTEILSEIAAQAVQWVDADASCFLECHPDKMTVVAINNLPKHLLGKAIAYDSSLVGETAKQKNSIIITANTTLRDDRLFADFADAVGSVIMSPMIFDDSVMGVLVAVSGNQGRLLGKEDIRLLELMCNQAAVALSQDRMFTEQRYMASALSAAHNQLHSVLTSTENPIIAVGKDLSLVFANTAAQLLFDMTMRDEGKHIAELIPQELFPTDYAGILQNIQQDRVHIYETFFRDRTFLAHIARIGIDNIEGWVVVLNDVSQLKELDRIKSEMVRMTSHDLKNPLQAALANIDLIRDDLEDNQTDEIAISVDNIERQLIRMNRIISGILDLERIRTTTGASEIIHPATLVESAVSELSDISRERNITVTVDIEGSPSNILGDPHQLERVMVNILENAVKFSRNDSLIEVKVTDDGERVLFMVTDHGIGIPVDLQERIFERFYRGMQSGAEHISGSGLGLSLVKTVVDKHRGEVWVESTENVGTTFYVALPHIPEALIYAD